ncbi:CarD family transcriptional regulator [Paenibacillus sp. M1]|uniref:CarD family transcriptional regulator n=1 Tax=Paenibacillus haidiansis TaxID=1574488 RepID=A0ABU7VQZ2_9BACL
MYKIGDFIIYGQSGVCEIQSIDYPQVQITEGEKKLYYKLSPVYSTEVIYTPVDSRVFMRPVVTPEEAKEMIAQIAGKANAPGGEPKFTPDEYDAYLKTHDCRDLIKLMKTIHYKKHGCVQNGKKITPTDQKYLKRAEELLFSELAVVMGTDIEAAKEIVDDALSTWLVEITA